jgi:hypothetical protein
MTPRIATLALIAAAGVAAPVAASYAANQIEGIEVLSGPPPIVQSSYPTSGQHVPFGVMILKIVFDRPMKPDGWAYGPSAGADYPSCLAQPRLLSDQRTFVLLCTVPADHSFALEINPTGRFASTYSRAAKPFTLQFSTTDDRTDDVNDALKQAGLSNADDPIMTTEGAVRGSSQTAPAP